MRFKFVLILAMVVFLYSGTSNPLFAGNGYFLHGIGPVNEALGGAGVAGNPQDVMGSIYRNPANGILFDGRKASAGFGAILPNTTVNSSVDLLGVRGSSDSGVDIVPCSNIGLVLKSKNKQTAYYLAMIGEAGLHLDILESTGNPIFMPQAGKANNPFGGLFGGFGAMETQLEVVRIPLGISYRFDNKWAMGFSVAPSVSRIKFTPGAFAAPDDANGDGIYTYPDVNHELALGIGFQAGIRYQPINELAFGFSLTTPTWFEEFEWDVEDESGNSRKISFRLNRPLTLRLGTNYRLTSATMLFMDISWINYSQTSGFDGSGFAPDGSLAGLGWEDIWVLSLGVQYDIGDLTLRAGYNYGSNPIEDENTFFNVGSPLHVRHHLSVGASYGIFKQATLDIGYSHAFKSSQSGPMYDMKGPVPGTEVETELEYDQLSIGVTFPF
jgi:long-chain fatty acid transport protein